MNIESLTTEQFGEVTIKGILSELAKPNRDPRPEFKTATFAEGINEITDLKIGMILEGIVSNVANFGAFVDIGVHQDGLVHISAITDKFISDPSEFLKAGEIVKVKVVDVDAPRKRISLTMRLNDNVSAQNSNVKQPANQRHQNSKHSNKQTSNAKPETNQRKQHKPKAKKIDNAAMGNAFADAFAKLKK